MLCKFTVLSSKPAGVTLWQLPVLKIIVEPPEAILDPPSAIGGDGIAKEAYTFPGLTFGPRFGAAFLCIEPWRGFASPPNFDGEFADKPGVMHIAPGATEVLSYRIGVR